MAKMSGPFLQGLYHLTHDAYLLNIVLQLLNYKVLFRPIIFPINSVSKINYD